LDSAAVTRMRNTCTSPPDCWETFSVVIVWWEKIPVQLCLQGEWFCPERRAAAIPSASS
jgi:hypothetical protein